MSAPNFLRIATVLSSLHSITNESGLKDDGMVGFRGLTEIAEIFSQKLGFSYELCTPSDSEWGRNLGNGSWTGAVGMLQRGEVDMIVTFLSITEDRCRVMDFSYPYLIDRLVFATRSLVESNDKLSFLKTFSLEVWIWLCVTLLILPATYFIQHERTFRHFAQSRGSFFRMSGNVSERTGEIILKTTWLIGQVFLRWSYAAVLLSFLTFPSLTGIRNIPELADAVLREEYYCTSYAGSTYADLILSASDPNLKTIGQSLKNNKGYRDFDSILSSTNSSKKVAFIAEEMRLAGVNTKYFVSKEGFIADYFSVGIKKEFCCKRQLDSVMHVIWSSGINKKIIGDIVTIYSHKIL